ncbi:hypothetical protein D9M72_559390 [compost metagenome]
MISEKAARPMARTPITTPMIPLRRPNGSVVRPVSIMTRFTTENRAYPAMAIIKNFMALGVARTLPLLNSSSVTAKTDSVPMTACSPTPGYIPSRTRVRPPRKSPSRPA